MLAGLAFVGALIFGVTGFGAALVTIPLATHFVPLEFALALFVLVDVAYAFSVGLENPRNAVRAEWLRLVPTIALGTAIGVTLLVNLPRTAATAALGLFVVLYSVYSFLKPGVSKPVSMHWGWLAGLAGGITSSVFGSGGPPYAIYLSQRGLGKDEFRATMGFATMTSISLRLCAFLLTGLLLHREVWLAALFAVPAALLGIAVARRVFFRISREMLMRAVGVMLLASGTSLLWRSLG